MGMIVESNGVELWSPSLRTGAMFIEQMQMIERILSQKSGFEVIMDDTIEVNPKVLAVFVEQAIQMLETINNRPLFAMISGCVQIAIALNARINGQWPPVSDRLQPLLDGAKSVMN